MDGNFGKTYDQVNDSVNSLSQEFSASIAYQVSAWARSGCLSPMPMTKVGTRSCPSPWPVCHRRSTMRCWWAAR